MTINLNLGKLKLRFGNKNHLCIEMSLLYTMVTSDEASSRVFLALEKIVTPNQSGHVCCLWSPSAPYEYEYCLMSIVRVSSMPLSYLSNFGGVGLCSDFRCRLSSQCSQFSSQCTSNGPNGRSLMDPL